MSIRVGLLVILVLGLCYYAWFRSWFVALCGAIVLLAVLQHPDMPRTIGGIQGLNLWNFLFVNVSLAWLYQRSRDGLVWDMPATLVIAFLLYFAVVTLASMRLVVNPTQYIEESRKTLLMDTLINPIKFFIPCILLYDGCRTRERVSLATGCIVFVYFALAIQVIKYMGITELFGGDLEDRSARVIDRDVGFHRVDMSMMLAGGSWALVAYAQLFKHHMLRLFLWGCAAIIVLGQALTAGRAGYVAWMATGVFLCVLRWRKLLPLIPVGILCLMIVAPGVRDRMLTGLGQSKGPIKVESNKSELTAGRSDIWPFVVKQIGKAPVVGNGRHGMQTTGLTYFASTVLNDAFAHPHNAYLEMLLDNGAVGFFAVIPLYFFAWWRSLSLFVDRTDDLFQASGGVALVLVTTLLVAGLGAQTLYPREGVVPMWAAIGVALRVYQERAAARRDRAFYQSV